MINCILRYWIKISRCYYFQYKGQVAKSFVVLLGLTLLPIAAVASVQPLPKPSVAYRVLAKRGIHKPVHPPRRVMVVIDPGHGGKDPGAIGPRGYAEKEVVLAIARRLQHFINQQPGFHAVLTRQGNYFISLRHRLAIARRYRADMFIAIHADAYWKTSSRGASVYALSERGATSEAARWLAHKENVSELMGGAVLSNKDHLLRSVLINLSQNYTIGVSLRIGQVLLHQLAQFAPLHHDRVEQAAFVVLKSPDIPSLLVETGFLSNRREEHRLLDPRYQKRLAYGLMRGITHYFYQHPPRGSVLALQTH